MVIEGYKRVGIVYSHNIIRSQTILLAATKWSQLFYYLTTKHKYIKMLSNILQRHIMGLAKTIAEYGYLTEIFFEVSSELYNDTTEIAKYFKYIDNFEFKLPEEQARRLGLAPEEFAVRTSYEMYSAKSPKNGWIEKTGGKVKVGIFYRLENRKIVDHNYFMSRKEDFLCFSMAQTISSWSDYYMGQLAVYLEGEDEDTFQDISKYYNDLIADLGIAYPWRSRIVHEFWVDRIVVTKIWVEKKHVLETEEGKRLWE